MKSHGTITGVSAAPETTSTYVHKHLSQKVEECKELLRSTKRTKIEELIIHIEKMGYFIAPGSLEHHRFEGGLVSHSLEVYKKALKLREDLIKEGVDEQQMPVNSVILSALLHDVCKADELRFDKSSRTVKVVKQGKGHSARSVRQVSYSGFVLTNDEKEAILWHMGGKRIIRDDKKRAEFFASHPLASIINKADGSSIHDAKVRHHSQK